MEIALIAIPLGAALLVILALVVAENGLLNG